MPEGVKVYFDTNLYFNKFQDPYRVLPETNNMFNKVKSGEFRLIISQSILMEMYHVMCLPIEKISKFEEAEKAMKDIANAYNDIKTTILHFPNTDLAKNEFDGMDPLKLIDFVENVPGSSLIEYIGKKLPGSMDFMHVMIASNQKCEKFFTYDKGLLLLDSNQQKGNMRIIRPYKP